MINKIRKILLVLVVSLVLTGAYYLYTNHQKSGVNVKLRMTEQGMDVVIENFKVVHENEGHRDWELVAQSAQVNNKNKLTYLNNVKVTLDVSEDQKYWVSADKGTLKNDTQDFALEGNVKLTAQSEPFLKKLQPADKTTSQPAHEIAP